MLIKRELLNNENSYVNINTKDKFILFIEEGYLLSKEEYDNATEEEKNDKKVWSIKLEYIMTDDTNIIDLYITKNEDEVIKKLDEIVLKLSS